ncbi:hypothetical protein KC960_03490, partial [Candidatus Saccharibacteria bacterium]|nr:hypothetical protein [Candidatus Saccharibacteria bacterium]
MIKVQSTHLSLRQFAAYAQAAVLALGLLLPLLIIGRASAAPVLTSRVLTSTTARPSVDTDLTWSFATTADVANIDYIEIEFCDDPLSTCTTNNVPSINSATPTVTLSGFTTDTTTASVRQNGDNGGTDNQIQIDKTTADAGASLTPTISFAATDFTNNASANTSYYTRMRIYSDTGTTLVWEGVFAQSTSQTLTVTARVQERLDFCVGETGVDDATTSVGADCSAITGTDVALGVVDPSNTNVSPVTSGAAPGADNQNGVAMIRTNASGGASVGYKALQETSSGALKVVGATCSGLALNDQCFNSVGTTQDNITAGAEEFGMAVAGVNCGSTTAYTCVFATPAYNLIRDNQYDGDSTGQNDDTYVSDAGLVAGTTVGDYAWDDTGTLDTIASSTSSSVKQIDDEALILKFAATAQ